MSTAPPHPAAEAAAAWHLAGGLVSLKAAVDAHWPGRDKRSDGGIGDERHQAEGSASDHNPWLNNTVRAYDFTATQPAAGIHGVDGDWLAEQLRLVALHGDPRFRSGGYVIYNRHVTSPDFTRWVAYSGSDPHTSHVHVSVGRDPAGYEWGGPWEFLSGAPLHPPAPPAPAPAPAPPVVAPVPPAPAHQEPPAVGPHPGNSAHEAPAPLVAPSHAETGTFPPRGHDGTGSGEHLRAQYGNCGDVVHHLQVELNRVFPNYSNLVPDGDYGPETAAVIEEFQRRVADGDPHCPTMDREALAEADGYSVGPATARAFARFGIHV